MSAGEVSLKALPYWFPGPVAGFIEGSCLNAEQQQHLFIGLLYKRSSLEAKGFSPH